MKMSQVRLPQDTVELARPSPRPAAFKAGFEEGIPEIYVPYELEAMRVVWYGTEAEKNRDRRKLGLPPLAPRNERLKELLQAGKLLEDVERFGLLDELLSNGPDK